jgi:Fe-S-cluster containining protein
MDNLYKALILLSSQPDCGSCNNCEKNIGLVYLIGEESSRLEKLGKKTVETSKGVKYLERRQNHGQAMWCNFFDVKKNLCTIYELRPLCCRLYPIDLMKFEGALYWVAHTKCPITRRFQRDRKLDLFAAITIRLESELTPLQLRKWIDSDSVSQTIEAFERDYSNVIKLRQYGEKQCFPRWGPTQVGR